MRVSDILKVKGNTLYTVTPDTALNDAVNTMAEHDIGSLVVMEHGELKGMLTFREVLAALAKGGIEGRRVADIYERNPITATPKLDVMELRGLMLERHQRYVPVMDGTTLLGVISFHDVAKAVYEEASFENKMLKSYIEDSPTAAR